MIEQITPNHDSVIVGFAMYAWIKSAKFKHIVNSNITDSKYQHNRNLMENWHRINDHEIYLTDIGIHPRYQNKGLCKLLLNGLIDSFPDKTIFTLDVSVKNQIAIKCYQHCGFVIKYLPKNYYPGMSEGMMRMRLVSHNDL